MTKIVFASGNKGKIAELNYFLAPHRIECISQDELGLTPAIEDGKTFIENAILKARHIAKFTDLPVLADDSGIIIDKLDGEPGIYSARYAGDECDSKKNVAKVIANLTKKKFVSSPARFCCALAFFQSGENDQMPAIFTGVWEGSVITSPRGSDGFGYDPIFLDLKSNKTAAEMGGFAKQTCSHRVKALKKFISYFVAT
jgi:XTP/dITP diphosphohydrolase